MIKLFLRFYVAATCALFFSLMLASFVISDFYKQAEAQDYVRMTRALHQLFVNQEAQYPNKTISDIESLIVNEFQKDYPFLIKYVSSENLDKAVWQAVVLNGVHVDITLSWWRNDISVLYPSSRADLAVRYIPANDFGEPYAIMILIAEGFVLIGFAVALIFLIAPLKRHVNKLVKVSESIGRGDFDKRADEKSPAPIGELAAAINSMALQLKGFQEDREIMMGAAAHELRTPLARLRFAMDLIPQIDESKLRKHLSDMEPDLDQLELLVEEVLAFSRLSSGGVQLSFEHLNVEDEAAAIVKKIRPLRDNIEVTITGSTNHGPIVRADRIGFERAIVNVLRNAQRHARTVVVLAIKQKSEYEKIPGVFLVIEDDGEGLPEDEYNKIKKAFYRSDESRNSDTGGTGLGLAIVDKIMQSHHGSICFSPSSLGGLRVELFFPSKIEIT